MVCSPRFVFHDLQPTRGSHREDERGFTLFELVVVIGLISVVALVSAEFFGFGARLYATVNVRQELLQTTRMAMHRMMREITAADSVVSADASSFRFLDPEDADITFALSGSQVFRNTDPLLDLVTSLTFDYRNRDGAVLATPVADPSGSVWRVAIAIAVSRFGQSMTLQSEVYLRRGG